MPIGPRSILGVLFCDQRREGRLVVGDPAPDVLLTAIDGGAQVHRASLMLGKPKEGACYPQPVTLEERVAIARNFVDAFGYTLPMLVGDGNNAADELYAGWPERLYVIDEHGRIACKGDTGPFGYEPDEVEAWFAARCGR